MNYYYRYEIDYFHCGEGGVKGVTCVQYQVVSATRCGVWVVEGKGYYWAKKRFVLNTSRKKFAYPAKKEALVGFIKRKERYIRILGEQVCNTSEALRFARKIDVGTL